jgi:hypothetical protein
MLPTDGCSCHQGAFAVLGLTAVHPFMDGNGRMARLLLNWVLCNHARIPFVVGLCSSEIHRKEVRNQHQHQRVITMIHIIIIIIVIIIIRRHSAALGLTIEPVRLTNRLGINPTYTTGRSFADHTTICVF